MKYRLGTSAFMTEPVAFAWAGFYPNDQSIPGGFGLGWANNKNEFTNALLKLNGLAVSVVFATVLQCY